VTSWVSFELRWQSEGSSVWRSVTTPRQLGTPPHAHTTLAAKPAPPSNHRV
jgi:hypothetical protein